MSIAFSLFFFRILTNFYSFVIFTPFASSQTRSASGLWVPSCITLAAPMATASRIFSSRFKELEALGCPKVVVNNLARCDMAEAVEDAFRYGKIVLATTTYNNGIFPFMNEFIHHLTERNYQNRKIGIIENGTWAPSAAKTIKKMLEGSKDITFTDTVVTVNAAVKGENIPQIKALASEIM